MPSRGPLGAPTELATILYYASRGFTPEAIRYFLRKKAGSDHIWIQAIIDTMERFSKDGGFNDKPQIFDSRTRMWHLDGVDHKVEELLSAYVDKDEIKHITKFTPEDELAVLTVGLKSCSLLFIDAVAGRVWRACFDAPATQRQSAQSGLGSTP